MHSAMNRDPIAADIEFGKHLSIIINISLYHIPNEEDNTMKVQSGSRMQLKDALIIWINIISSKAV